MKKIFFLITMLVWVHLAGAQNGFWESAPAPYGGDNCKLTKASNGALYASVVGISGNRIFKSTDNGYNWVLLKQLNNIWNGEGLYDPNTSVTGNAGTIFFTNRQSGEIFKTTDEGQNWVSMGSDIKKILGETSNGVILAQGLETNGSPLLRSTDGGQSWTQGTDTINWAKLSSFEINPYGIIVASVDVFDSPVNYGALCISTDDGLTWSSVIVEEPIDILHVLPNGTIIGQYDIHFQRFVRSTDGGHNFTQTTLGAGYYPSASFIQMQDGRIFSTPGEPSFGMGIIPTFFSDDDGVTWDTVPYSSTKDRGRLQQIEVLSDGTIFKNNYNLGVAPPDGFGLQRSTDGINWTFSGNGLDDSYIHQLEFDTDDRQFVTNTTGLWKTENGGTSWWLLLEHQNYNYNKLMMKINHSGGVFCMLDNKLWHSTNFGVTFSQCIIPVVNPDSALIGIELSPDGQTLFASETQKIWRSTNGGASWQEIPDVSFYNLTFIPSGRIIANAASGIYTSDDEGQTWQLKQNGSFSPAMAQVKDTTYILDRHTYLTLWQSTDSGETWTKLPTANNIHVYQPFCLLAGSNGHLFFNYGYSHNFYRSTDGILWQNIPFDPRFSYSGGFAISPDQHLYYIENHFATSGIYRTIAPVTQGALLEGHIRLDADADCSTPDAQQAIQNRILLLDGASYDYTTISDANGQYRFFVDTGAYALIVQNPNDFWWDYCEDTLAVSLPELFEADTVDFSTLALADCPLMSVNVALPFMRRCFDNTVYVNYCNQGTQTADSAYVDIALDPYLTFVSSDQPNTDLGGNVIRFFVGNIASGACGSFKLVANLSCDSTIIGQTHCVTAHGFPDTLCTATPDWSGAEITATIECQDTTIQITLQNTGDAGSSLLEYIIIEDDVVLFNGAKQYQPDETFTMEYPADGHTWRIESEQEPGHPFSYLALAYAEGCGGFESLGFINQFTVNGSSPSWHTACRENSGSYDPNDKQGFPLGQGDAHHIAPGLPIDYLIRFQNTGTDTAFTVVVRDTLSAMLDPLSIRPGASSHPYTWSMDGQGVLSFQFAQIMLPDSNVNEPASHGFVQFNISPRTDLPLGSVIENKAGIYFDFNEPVVTNTSWHTLHQPQLSGTFNPQQTVNTKMIDITPNPVANTCLLHLTTTESGPFYWQVYDVTGKLVLEQTTVGKELSLQTEKWPIGAFNAVAKSKTGHLLTPGEHFMVIH